MTHVVQFTSFGDFLADLYAGETAAIYHDLIEQRISKARDYDITRWVTLTVIRAIVANSLTSGKTVAHVAALAIPHGRAVDRVNGLVFGPPSSDEDKAARRAAIHEEHGQVVDYVRERLANFGNFGLVNLFRAGILNVPADLTLLYALNPLDELVEQANDFHPGGDGSPD